MSVGEVLSGQRRWHVECADCVAFLRSLPEGCVHCCVTSPPFYGLRNYGVEGQIGLEETPEAYVERLVGVFAEVWRVLRDDGTLWLNLGDSYNAAGRVGHGTRIGFKQGTNRASANGSDSCRSSAPELKEKDLLGIPWMVAFALRAAGWYLRSEIIWHKRSPMPESVTDRPTKAHEQLFLLAKRPTYYYDAEAVKERAVTATASDPSFRANGKITRRLKPVDVPPGSGPHKAIDVRESSSRNLRSVWRLSSESYKGAHFATFPTKLVTPCIKAGTSEKGVCPACGAPCRRLTKKDRKATRPGKDTKVTVRGEESPTNGTSGEYTNDGRAQFRSSEEVGNRDPQRHCTVTETVGWQPGCKCDAGEPIAPLVLDPFGGAATTVLVAVRLGRRGLCCDLNPRYVEMGRKRIQADMPLFA